MRGYGVTKIKITNISDTKENVKISNVKSTKQTKMFEFGRFSC